VISTLQRWLGVAPVVHRERYAFFAAAMSGLVDRGVSFDAALVVAATASRDAGLIALTRAESGRSADENAADKNGVPQRLSPLLRWALWESEPAVSRARALEIAAHVYRQASRDRAGRVRVLAPMFASAVVGGGVTLLFGLAVFLPVVELLLSIASQT
jgi:hypothetical protein